MFLPPNTTSLLQPMDQSVIATFKAYYLRRVLKEMLRVVNKERDAGELSNDVVRKFWKNFNIGHSLTMVDESWKELKETTLNKSWRKLLPEFVASSTPVDSEETAVIRDATNVARNLGGEGFGDAEENDIRSLVIPEATPLDVHEVEAILEQPCEEDPLEEEPVELAISLSSVSKIMSLVHSVIEEALILDPVMTRSLLFKQDLEKALEAYKILHADLLRRAKQSRVTDYFVRQ